MSLPPDRPIQLLNGTPDSDRVGELLERYLAARTSGTMDPDVRAFAESHTALIRTAETLREVWQKELAPRETEPTGYVPLVRPMPRRVPGSRIARRNVGLWVATPLVACLVGLCLVIALKTRTSPQTQVPQVYATHTGQRATVTLADGSHVMLAPQTTLIVGDDFGGRRRTVSLAGEARFDVTSNVGAPFLVRTGKATTRVLGTSFMVRRYATDRNGRVAVYDGKVATDVQGSAVVLTDGMAAQFTDSSVAATAAAANEIIDWERGRLIFRDVPVPTFLAALTRWYGYEFRLADSTLSARTVTAVLTMGETKEMMRGVRYMLGVTMTVRDSVITLQPSPTAGVIDRDTRRHDVKYTREVGR